MPASTQPHGICELSSLPGLHLSPYLWLCSFSTFVSHPVSALSSVSRQSHQVHGLFPALPTYPDLALQASLCAMWPRLTLPAFSSASSLPVRCLHRLSSGTKHMDFQRGESWVPSLATTLHYTDPSCPLLTNKFFKVGSSSLLMSVFLLLPQRLTQTI